jgi:UDP-N-acetylmuramoyl-tripeptide--D-alanyl-D-alanine ligase
MAGLTEVERHAMQWTLGAVAATLGAPLAPGLDPGERLAGVSIDSRTVRPGELFVAIRGPRLDGHDYVAAALAAGAPAAVVARAREVPGAPAGKLFPVEDPLAALHELARAVRRAWAEGNAARRLAAVTGSTGKTTTKEILAALVETRFRTLRSEGNLNNEYGLPLTLCRLDDSYDAAVVELGMSHRGELARLAALAGPELGVVTNVAPVHLEFFSSVDEIALAKRELIEALAGHDPIAVLNADDARVARFAAGFRGRVLTFGESPAADFRAAAVASAGERGTAFDFHWPGGRARLELPLVGAHNVMNALAALAAASAWGIGAEEARSVFPNLAPVAMRGRVLRFAEGFTVVDDSYNSNPLALDCLVDWLAGVAGYRRRILAAGEMLELGPRSAELHRAAGRHAAEKRLDWIFGVQGDARELVDAAVHAGHPASRAQFFPSSSEAASFLAGFIEPGDLLLVKGSRGVQMERIVARLAARHAPDPSIPRGRPGRSRA